MLARGGSEVPVERRMGRILIVDDDPDFADGLVDVLDPRVYELAIAATSEQARLKAIELEAQVALIDIRLGGGNGITLIDDLKLARPDILCVVMTGYAELDTAIEALRRGAYDYLRKPFREKVLFATLDRCFDRLRLLREKAEAEAALRESEGRLRLALEAAQDGVWDWNVSTGAVTYSDRWSALLGYDPREIEPSFESWKQRVHPDDLPHALKALDDHLAGRTPLYEYEHRMRTKSGEWKWIHGRGKVVERAADGRALRVAGTNRDITERKALEDRLNQAEKMEAVGELAGGVAHDFNNLLTVISGHTDIIAKRLASDPEIRASVEAVERAVEQAAGVTRSLLTFSHKLPTDKQPIDFSVAVQAAVRMLRHTLPAVIELVVDTRCDPKPWVNADKIQMQQIVLNLAVNARDAMPDGGTLYISVSPPAPVADSHTDARTQCTRLVVRDTGAGIPPEARPRIFEPFFTTKPEGKGTGLGLAIIHGIVTDHGGTVEFESEVGAGSTFTVALPCITAQAAALMAEQEENAPDGRGEVILLAEDYPQVREIMVATLAALGYEVVPVRDGDALLESFERHRGRIGLFVIDIDLPKRSGLDALRLMRARGAEAPSIVITGSVDARLGDLDDGKTTLLRKPFAMAALGRLVRDMIGASIRADREA